MTDRLPEIGDTVIIRGIVIDDRSIKTNFPDSIKIVCLDATISDDSTFWVNRKNIMEVIPKPWEPKPGDVVFHKDYSTPYVLIHIFQHFAFIISNTPNAVPYVVFTSDLRKEKI
jgi:hypothetical protein